MSGFLEETVDVKNRTVTVGGERYEVGQKPAGFQFYEFEVKQGDRLMGTFTVCVDAITEWAAFLSADGPAVVERVGLLWVSEGGDFEC